MEDGGISKGKESKTKNEQSARQHIWEVIFGASGRIITKHSRAASACLALALQ